MVGVQGYSPAYALYGRELRFPTETWLDMYRKAHPNIDGYIDGLVEALSNCWENIYLQLVENQDDITSDKPRLPRIFKEFEIGDYVYRKIIPKTLYKYYLDQKEYKIIKKLQHRFSGPFKIVEKYSPVRYAIEEEGQVKQLHALNLKPGGKVNRLTSEIL